MPPCARKPDYTVAETLLLGPGETLGRGDGSWKDVDYRDLSRVFGSPDGSGGREPYDQASLDRQFLTAPGTRYLCAPLQWGLGYTNSQIDDALKAVFQFQNGYEWR